MKKRLLSILLAACFIVTLLPSFALAATTFTDMPSDYSTTALEAAVANGLLNGSNGKILPNDDLTRAQMAAIIGRAFGATQQASLGGFTDVPASAWYYADMGKAVQMKILNGNNGLLNPNAPITRQEAFAVLARALKLKDGTAADLASFTDKSDVSSWAIGTTAAMVSNGYIHGANGKIYPNANISRKDFAIMMDNVIKNYIKTAGTVTKVNDGSVMINTPDVTLGNVTVKGNLIIGDGVGSGTVTLDNVKVEGATIVRGGGVNSLIVKGGSSLGTVSIAKVDGNIRLHVEDSASVEVVEIQDGKNDILVEGNIAKLVVASSDTPVAVQNATIGEVSVTAKNANVTVAKTAEVKTVNTEAAGTALTVNGKVGTVNASAAATGAKVEVSAGAKIETVNAAAAGTAITGSGTVANANVTANNVKVDTNGTKTTVAKNVTGTTAGGKDVQPGTSTTTGGQTPTSGGGGGQTGPSAAQLAALKAVNDATGANNYAAVKTAIENNAATLGLDLTNYNTLEVSNGNRQAAVCNDLYNSKPDGGYNLSTLKAAFDEIVATRIVFQDSVKLVNDATADNPLKDVEYVNMLIKNLSGVKNYTKHSGIAIKDKVAQLQTLVDRYNALSSSLQAEALKTVSDKDYQSSTQTLDALDTALKTQEGKVTTALKAVNEATKDNNYAAVKTAIENNAATLGLDLTNYNTLEVSNGNRQAAVCNDLYNSKPDGGYNLSTLKAAFDEIVASRIVFQDSVKLVNDATADNPLKDVEYVNMLIKNLSGVKKYTKHSGIAIKDKVAQLQTLVDRYNALSSSLQAEALKTVSDKDYQSSTQTLDALDTALKTQEGKVTTALKAVNEATKDNNYAAVKTAIENNAATLGLDLTNYNTLEVSNGNRQAAVCNDLYNSKPDGGYNLSTLKAAFDEIVATRIVFQDSVKLVNDATADNPLKDVEYVNMLIKNLSGVKNYTKHSGIAIKDKVAQLQTLVDRYNALSPVDKTAALKDVSSADYQSSTQTLDALNTAIKTHNSVDVARLHDNSSRIQDGELVSNYSAKAVKQVDKNYIDVAVAGTDLQYHQNGKGIMGFWIGFALAAPADATGYKYAFAPTQDGLATLELQEKLDAGIDSQNHSGVAFYANLADNTPKTWAKVQWVGKDGKDIGSPITYYMDLSQVTLKLTTALLCKSNMNLQNDLTVDGGSITVATGANLVVKSKLVVNSKLDVKKDAKVAVASGANLIVTSKGNVDASAGTITYDESGYGQSDGSFSVVQCGGTYADQNLSIGNDNSATIQLTSTDKDACAYVGHMPINGKSYNGIYLNSDGTQNKDYTVNAENHLFIGNGKKYTIGNGTTLTVKGKVINGGTIENNGKVHLEDGGEIDYSVLDDLKNGVHSGFRFSGKQTYTLALNGKDVPSGLSSISEDVNTLFYNKDSQTLKSLEALDSAMGAKYTAVAIKFNMLSDVIQNDKYYTIVQTNNALKPYFNEDTRVKEASESYVKTPTEGRKGQDMLNDSYAMLLMSGKGAKIEVYESDSANTQGTLAATIKIDNQISFK